MTLPNIPTDNYYKFFALSGVVICITCVILFFNQLNEINDDLDKIDIEITQLEVEKRFIEEDSLAIHTSISKLGTYDTSLAKLNIDSLITDIFIKSNSSLQNDKNLRDYYEFLFKYEDKIVPIGPKVRQLREARVQQQQFRRSLSLKTALLAEKIKAQRHKYNQLTIATIALIVFFIVGIRISIRGFKNWYNLVQKPSDEKLALEIETLKKTE